MSYFELFLYTLRHVQEHAAQLSLFLGQREQACQIYYDKYWLPSNANTIPDVRLGYIHLDTAVNCGVSTAKLFLTRLSRKPSLFESNGKNQALWNQLLLEYTAIRMNYYTHCKGKKYYLEGWINRLVDVIKNALSMKVGQ